MSAEQEHESHAYDHEIDDYLNDTLSYLRKLPDNESLHGLDDDIRVVLLGSLGLFVGELTINNLK